MTPAISCEVCGPIARTKHEPATKEEMQRLFNKAELHAMVNVSASLVAAFDPPLTRGHYPHVVYHEQTPAGFESVEVFDGTEPLG